VRKPDYETNNRPITNIRRKTMKKYFAITITLVFLIATFAGCASDVTTVETTSVEGTSATTEPVDTTEPAETTEPTEVEELSENYYLAGSFNGYVADDEQFILEEVEGAEGVFSIKLNLLEELRDPAYDGHWYKITDGTWDKSWGTDVYELQPAPVKETKDGEAIGLGSIWIDDDGEYTIIFDSNEPRIYDTSMVQEVSPRIYGDFNVAMDRGADWGFSDEEALLLTDVGDGTFAGEYTLPAYSGEGDGYSMAVLVSLQFSTYLPWYGWGAGEQYLFDGSAAAMGNVSTLTPEEDTTYLFEYNSDNNVTTITEVD
jgi:hypothetical protein